MNNEPVAWNSQNTFCSKCHRIPSQCCCSSVKELTDEEITEVITKIANNNEYVYSLYEDFEGIEFSRIGIFEFARAILRKAQEK